MIATATSERECKECLSVKPLEDFPLILRRTGKRYHLPRCKKCHHKRRYARIVAKGNSTERANASRHRRKRKFRGGETFLVECECGNPYQERWFGDSTGCKECRIAIARIRHELDSWEAFHQSQAIARFEDPLSQSAGSIIKQVRRGYKAFWARRERPPPGVSRECVETANQEWGET